MIDRKEYQRAYRMAHKEKAREYNRLWRERNLARKRDADRRYAADHRAEACERAGRWYRHNKQKPYKNFIAREYRMTMVEYEAMLTSQGGVCKICGNPTVEGKRLHVDHCHKSGKIRGLLCHHCNLMLGQAMDNARTLRSAALYLEN